MICNRCDSPVKGTRCLKCGGSPVRLRETKPEVKSAATKPSRKPESRPQPKPTPTAEPKQQKDPTQMSTSERLDDTKDRIASAESEIQRLRRDLGRALAVAKAEVKTSQTSLMKGLQAELDQLEQRRRADLANHEVAGDEKLAGLDKAEARRRSQVSNLVKQTALKLRDLGQTWSAHRPVIESDQLVPATEVREFFTVGDLKYPKAAALDRDLPRVPALVPFVDKGHLIIETPSGTSDEPDPVFQALLTSLVAQTYASAPAGQIVVTVFNPRSSKVLAGFRPTGAEAAGLLKVLQPTRDAFEKALDELLTLTQRAESSIGTYASMGELVRSTGQHEHQYRVLVIIDGPGDWSTKSVDLLDKLMTAGSKAGLSVLLHRDPATPAPDRVDIERLYQHGSVLRRQGANWLLAAKRVAGQPLRIEPVPAVSIAEQARLMTRVVNGAEIGSLPSIPFSELVEHADATTESGIKITMGKKGTQTTQFVLGDTASNIQNILVGGRAGSGKTNLLKVMIYSMAARYPREELELFLLDFKEGGDFMPFVGDDGYDGYAALPNASVVSRDCDAGFGLATLRHFEREMDRRSNLTSENGVSNIWDLRKRTGIKVPRWVLIIDEFQGLFSGPTYEEATEMLENFVRKGRSFGLHVVLATQTLSGVKFAGSDKDKAIFENISGRVVLQLGPGEFTKFMESGNDEGDQLRYRGQAIFNSMGGRKSENQLFVVARADADHTNRLQDELHRRQVERGTISEGPFVYRGGEMVSAEELVRKNGRPVERDGDLPVWFGRQNTINPPVAEVSLSAIVGSHVLLLGGDERTMSSAIATLQTGVLSAVAGAKVPIDVIVFEELIPKFRRVALVDEWLDTLAALGANVVRFGADTAEEFIQSVEGATRARRRTIVTLLGAENSDLTRVANQDNLWRTLIREMPRRNVNVIGHWSDLRDMPGNTNDLKDDYKTLLIFGKNEQLVTAATKRSRYDLPPLSDTRTVVFSAATSQEGVTTVTSIRGLTRPDLAAFRAPAKGVSGSVTVGGAPAVVPSTSSTVSAGESASPIRTETDVRHAAPPEIESVRFGDLISPVGASSAEGVKAVLGQGAGGPVAVRLGGSSGVPHLLVAGGGHSGKGAVTERLMHALVAQHAVAELRMDLVDSADEAEFPDLKVGALPHLISVTHTRAARDVGVILTRYTDEAQRRWALLREAGAANIEQFRARSEVLPRWVLVWNEYPDALSDSVAAQVEWLAQHGADVGLHLVLTALTPVKPECPSLPLFDANSGRVLTRMTPQDSAAHAGNDSAAKLARRRQGLFANAVGEVGSVFSVPEMADGDLAQLRRNLGGDA